MNYVGVDIHKRYSFVRATDEQGHKLREARIEGNAPAAFAQFFAALDGPSKVVLEACWNWGLFHDVLDELEPIVLAHPFKTRLIGCGPTLASCRPHKPAAARFITGGSCRGATNGCNGRSSKPRGSPSAARDILAGFTGSTASRPTKRLRSSRGQTRRGSRTRKSF